MPRGPNQGPGGPNQSPASRIRAPASRSRVPQVESGLVGRIRAPRAEVGPHGLNQGSRGLELGHLGRIRAVRRGPDSTRDGPEPPKGRHPPSAPPPLVITLIKRIKSWRLYITATKACAGILAANDVISRSLASSAKALVSLPGYKALPKSLQSCCLSFFSISYTKAFFLAPLSLRITKPTSDQNQNQNQNVFRIDPHFDKISLVAFHTSTS